MKFSKTILVITSFFISFSLFFGSVSPVLAATPSKPSGQATTTKKTTTIKKPTAKKAPVKKKVVKKKVVKKKTSSVNLNPPRITLETAPHSEKKVAKKKTTKKTVKKPAAKKKS